MIKQFCYFLIGFIVCSTQGGYSESTIPFTFEELGKYQLDSQLEAFQKLDQQWVQIRGFAYQHPSGKWILANEPNLKTCCIGSGSKIAKQLVLEGYIPPSSSYQAITLNGKLAFNPQWNQNAELIQVMSLKDIQPVPTSIFSRMSNFLILAAIILGFIYLKKRLICP